MKSNTSISVRYAETDRMGIVHHSRYYPWFEIARSDFIARGGMNYFDVEEMGIMLPLTETGAKYFEGMKYGDEAEVTCELTELTVVRCTFEYEVYRKSDGKLMVEGITKHAFVNNEFKPINLKKKYPQVWETLNQLKIL